jgi:hypothetical protein
MHASLLFLIARLLEENVSGSWHDPLKVYQAAELLAHHLVIIGIGAVIAQVISSCAVVLVTMRFTAYLRGRESK